MMDLDSIGWLFLISLARPLSIGSFSLSPLPYLIMLLGDPNNDPDPSFPPSSTHRSYIPSLIPPGVDPAKVDSKMFYTYVPNTIKTRKRTTPAQLEILEGVFLTDKKPNAPRRKELAKKLKMSPREVQVSVVLSPLPLFFFFAAFLPPSLLRLRHQKN